MEQNNPNPYFNKPDSNPENNNTVFYNRPGQPGGNPSPHVSGRGPVKPPNTFARVSLILGGVALVSVFTFTIVPAIILGALSLLLALLSRGRELTFHPSAKSAAILASIALGCNVAIFGGSMLMIFGDNSMHDQINETYEEMFGMTYDEILEGIMDGSIDMDDLYEQMYDNMY